MPEITLPKIPDGYDAEIEIKPDGSMKIKLTKSNTARMPVAAPEPSPPVQIVPMPYVPPYRPLSPYPYVDRGPWWEVTC